ncbi:hypothetical protein [Victivallis vadensis]|uniref:hypothetical protein n=1 Tax=Victivallis vadensis TaxID=172901 RepID=UPI0023F0C34E|nr:hypothetical protein [Victivallis vadensis]
MKYSLPFLSAVLAACTLCASDSKQLRTALFTSNLEISDRMYDYFLAAPGAVRTGKPVVPQGIIAFVERRDRWKQFLGQMPAKPDFLEIRTEMTISHRPDFSFHPRELNRSVDAAVAAGIDRIQISPRLCCTPEKLYGQCIRNRNGRRNDRQFRDSARQGI